MLTYVLLVKVICEYVKDFHGYERNHVILIYVTNQMTLIGMLCEQVWLFFKDANWGDFNALAVSISIVASRGQTLFQRNGLSIRDYKRPCWKVSGPSHSASSTPWVPINITSSDMFRWSYKYICGIQMGVTRTFTSRASINTQQHHAGCEKESVQWLGPEHFQRGRL